MFKACLESAINAALASVKKIEQDQITQENGKSLAEACAAAGAMSVAYVVSSICLPTMPTAAAVSAEEAANFAYESMDNQVSFEMPTKRSAATFRTAIGNAACAMTANLSYTFPPVPTAEVDCSIMAGDFNVDYPDNTTYQPSNRKKLGDDQANAYTSLTKISTGAQITNKTTRIGPTAFESQRIYSLITPIEIQNKNHEALNYVPLDLSVLTGQDWVGNVAWRSRLKELAETQDVSWSQLTAEPYDKRIDGAFNSFTVINDTSFYRANAYDNIFVRGGTVQDRGVIDVFSELGSWTQHKVLNPIPSVLSLKFADKIGPRSRGFRRRSSSTRRAWGARWYEQCRTGWRS